MYLVPSLSFAIRDEAFRYKLRKVISFSFLSQQKVIMSSIILNKNKKVTKFQETIKCLTPMVGKIIKLSINS